MKIASTSKYMAAKAYAIGCTIRFTAAPPPSWLGGPNGWVA
jgi:hypothetical protein